MASLVDAVEGLLHGRDLRDAIVASGKTAIFFDLDPKLSDGDLGWVPFA